MTADQRLLTDLTAWMDGEADTIGEPAYLAAVFTATRTMPQRPAWVFPERWLPRATWQPVGPRPRLVARIVLVIALALAALAALIVGSAGSRAVLFGDGVVGSGWRLLDDAPVARWTLEAHLDPWTGTAQGSYAFERDGGMFIGDVTCLRIDGSRAVVGGRITGGNVSDTGFLLWLDDGGASAGGPPGADAITFTPTAPSDPTWPAGLANPPTTCPSMEPTPGVEWRRNDGEVEVLDR